MSVTQVDAWASREYCRVSAFYDILQEFSLGVRHSAFSQGSVYAMQSPHSVVATPCLAHLIRGEHLVKKPRLSAMPLSIGKNPIELRHQARSHAIESKLLVAYKPIKIAIRHRMLCLIFLEGGLHRAVFDGPCFFVVKIHEIHVGIRCIALDADAGCHFPYALQSVEHR